MTSTTPASEAHPVLSDAERIEEAYKTVCGTEEPLANIKSYARALILIANGLDGDGSDPVARLAVDIEEIVEALQFDRDTLFHALHPNRGVLDTGVYGNDDDEIEGAAA